jgi:ubiquinone/menaquinone biosynthesis C-methylase UbiE
MSFAAEFLKKINSVCPKPVHPFNTQAEGKMSYAMWQYTKGEDTIKNYLQFTSADEMFRDKTILDVGCGAGGKSMYYLSLGAKKVVGIDVVEHYREESKALADELGVTGFEFVAGDAAKTNFEDESFDTVIMNDAMEHVAQPEAVLKEMNRILKKGGRLYVNFPPYYHPYGAHLSDLIGVPWVQVFFSDKTLIEVYKSLASKIDGGEDRVKFRIGLNEKGEEYFSYINKMTIKRFKKIEADCSMKSVYYREIPLRGFLAPLCKGALREYFVKMAVCVFEK